MASPFSHSWRRPVDSALWFYICTSEFAFALETPQSNCVLPFWNLFPYFLAGILVRVGITGIFVSGFLFFVFQKQSQKLMTPVWKYLLFRLKERFQVKLIFYPKIRKAATSIEITALACECYEGRLLHLPYILSVLLFMRLYLSV